MGRSNIPDAERREDVDDEEVFAIDQ